jgi:uncharacterized protein (DUF58 family)
MKTVERPDGDAVTLAFRQRLNRLRSTIRYAPTRRWAAIVALAAPAWLISGSTLGTSIAFSITALVLLAGFVDALAIPGVAQLHVQRQLPDATGLGDAATARYRFRSLWPLRLDIEVHDALTPAIETDGRATSATAPWRIGRLILPPHRDDSITLGFHGRERGEHRLAPVVLRVRGPIGLAQRTLEYPLDDSISIVPSITGVRRYRLLALQHRLREAGIRTIRRRGDGTSFANLREYVEGDDPRRMDWKASARRGRLITREYAIEQGQTIVIAIDAGRMMTQLAGHTSRFEHALASATVLADVATRSGDHVALIVFNDEVRAFVPPARGAFALRRIRDAMVPLFATMAEPDYAGAFRTLAARHRKRSLIVLFTDVIDPRASRALIAHTVRSTTRHLPLVVALQNDQLVQAAIPRADEGDALFASAAAEELLLEREEALARMRRAGVSVLDVSPTVMTAAVINRYLAIKARAML